MSGTRKRTRRAAPSPVPDPPVSSAADPELPSNAASPLDGGQFKQFISDEVQKAVTAALAETVSPLLATIGSSQPSPAMAVPTGNAAPTGPGAGSLSHPLNVPSHVRERILRGECVDLNTLLPEALGAPKRDTIQLNFSGSRTVELLDPSSGGHVEKVRRHVHDLVTWLEAWSRYMFVLCSHAPSRFSELMAYQATIVSANSSYYPEAWLEYDREFRLAISLDPSKRWDAIDGNLWQLKMTGRSRPQCSTCRITHPPSGSQCPFRASRVPNQQFAPRSAYTKSGKEICRNFQQGRCSNTDCKFAHVCSQCEGAHARPSCPRRFSTGNQRQNKA